MHQSFQGNVCRSDWSISKWISELKGLTKRFPKFRLPPGISYWIIPILPVLLKRLFVRFGWGVRGGYSCSSYLSSIIFASSSPLRVPRAILIVSSKFWVKNRYYHRAWVTCGQYDRHAFETSIVPADLSGPPSESFLIFPFCAFSSKNRLIPQKILRPPQPPRPPPPPPPPPPIPTLNAQISARGTYLIF